MCFGATASFTAAAILLPIGVMSLRAASSSPRSTSQRWFAAIPLLFATQQALEGLVWQVLAVAPWGRSDHRLGTAFLFFALFLWPFYMPFAAARMEPTRWRRRTLDGIALVGFVLGGYLIGCATFRPSYACIAGNNLYYGVVSLPLAKPVMLASYVLTSTGSLLLSSVRGVALFGASGLLASTLTALVFQVGFASVWCFFAAALSIQVLFIVRRSTSKQSGQR